jgi:hypothetical protein
VLDDDGIGPGIGQGARAGENRLGLFVATCPWLLETAELVHRLRGHPHVPHHRDADSIPGAPIELRHLLAAFQLHSLRTRASLSSRPSRAQAILDRRLIAEKRHVRDDLRTHGRHAPPCDEW